MKKKICIICARKGSKGIKNKNFIKIGKLHLFEITIKQAINSKLFDKIILSSDSNKIIQKSKKLGVDYTILRTKRLSNDSASKIDVIKDALKKAEDYYNTEFDFICDLDVTSPLRTTRDIKNCYKMIISKKFDNVFSVINSNKNPYFNIVEIKNNNLSLVKPLNRIFQSRQSAPKTFDMNASIYFWKRKVLFQKKSLINNRTTIYLMDNYCIDIDNVNDFEFVKIFFNRNKSKYLK